MINFTDAVSIEGTRRTTEGFLVATCRSVRTGVQDYLGTEVGKPEMPVVKVYRPPEEVFSQDSLQSFSHAPITDNHPAEQVNADNWRQLARGEVSTAAQKDGEWIMLPLILKDGPLINGVEAGKRELSAGYTCTLDWTAGVTDEGEAYDAIQRNIRINHLAVVDKARAGSKARIGDNAAPWGASPVTTDQKEEKAMPDNLKTVTVDGISIETTDVGAQVITKLQAKIADMATAATHADAAHKAAIEAKDAELGEVKAKLADAEGKIIKTEDLDKMAAARADLVAKVKAVDANIVTDGVSDADLRKAAVLKKLGDKAVENASDAEIGGMFKAITATTSNDNGRDTLGDSIASVKPSTVGDSQATRDSAREEYLKGLSGQPAA